MKKAKTFATVCSGIGAPEVATMLLGWRCVFGADIEAFPNAVREYHFPQVPNYGDMTRFAEWPPRCECREEHHHVARKFKFNGIEIEISACKICGGIRIDVIIAGTPCQAFSVAGLRQGLADPRGNLTLTFLGIVKRYAPRWVLWENVPGVLSEKTGAFGAFLGGLAELGYGFAYRILDAQYFGVAQRRRRVFVVGHSGGLWQRAAAVLFERESLCGNPPPRRETGKGTAHSIAPSIGASGRGFERAGETRGQDPVIAAAPTLNSPKSEVRRPGTDVDTCYTLQPVEVCGTITKQYASHHGRTAGSNGGVVPGQIIPVGIDGGEVGFALRANPSHSGDKGDGGVNTTLVAAKLNPMWEHGRFHCKKCGTDFGVNDYSERVVTCPNCKTDFIDDIHDYFQDDGEIEVDSTLRCAGDKDEKLVAHALKGEGFDASEDGTGRGTPIVSEVHPCLKSNKDSNSDPAMQARNLIQVIAHGQGNAERVSDGEPSLTCNHEAPIGFIPSGRDGRPAAMAVRRLTPRECERLQGFPDDYTLIPWRQFQKFAKDKSKSPTGKSFEEWIIENTGRGLREPTTADCPDGPRYKALGNSMAVPVIRWICERMDLVDELVPMKE